MRDNVTVRRIQQSSKNASLELNLPKQFTRLENLVRGDLLRCEIMNLKNGHNALILQKMEVTN
jgi:hypothetical protein